jgi:hypothetical protein
MRQERTWPQDAKQALRLLAAARYFLPLHLECESELEERYATHLRHAEFQSALELLEQIGNQHSGHENEANFWKELYYAAKHLELDEHAARYEETLRQIVEMQRLGL